MAKNKMNLDTVLWGIVWMAPLLGYVVAFWRVGSAPALFTYINENFSFDFIKSILDNVWQTAFDSELVLSGYLSYLVVVEVAHCLFDVVVFIPRFAHALVERCANFAGGKKW
ncbi:MAG: hypothetical protein E7663_01605 [Ruminococcaceae bacterium]|nr:hypothetical protein [Oscillospiraceae bacterium]